MVDPHTLSPRQSLLFLSFWSRFQLKSMNQKGDGGSPISVDASQKSFFKWPFFNCSLCIMIRLKKCNFNLKFFYNYPPSWGKSCKNTLKTPEKQFASEWVFKSLQFSVESLFPLLLRASASLNPSFFFFNGNKRIDLAWAKCSFSWIFQH